MIPPEYLKDASHFTGKADALLFPASEEEVARLLRQAQEEGSPVTVSGAGTGLTGGRVPQGGALLATEKMNRILEIRWDEKLQEGQALVEPGVSLKQLEEALSPKGLFYPPDPGEKAAFIGGTISTNASGPRSFKYGPTRSYVRRLRIVLPTGDLIEIRRGEEKARGGKLNLSIGQGKIIPLQIPSYRWPEGKSAAGYFSKPGMDLIDLFIGAEGTLGVVTQAELKILKKPESVASGVLFFDTEEDCYAFAAEAKRWAKHPSGELMLSPRMLEFFDSRSLKILSRKHDDLPEHAGAALLFEQECREAQRQKLLEEWMSRSEEFQARSSDCWFSQSPEEQAAFRKYRYDLPVLVNEEVARNGFRKLGTDLAVPDAASRKMFDLYFTDVPKSGLDYAIWGHLGDNHLHVNLLPKTPQEFEKAEALYMRLAKKAMEWGGTVSAEHGIGKARIRYLELMVGKKGMEEMARIKSALDPAWILNPGDILPPPAKGVRYLVTRGISCHCVNCNARYRATSRLPFSSIAWMGPLGRWLWWQTTSLEETLS